MAAIVAGLVMSVCAKAQDVQMVTLQHGENMTAYYGHTAFQQAMGAAAKGDLITLSGGSFASATINKVVTIQGAGYVQDMDNNRYCTTIANDLNIEIPEGDAGLVIEGVRFNNSVYAKGTIDNLIFRKCRLGYLEFNNSKNCLIDRCRVEIFNPDDHSENLMVKNSILGSVHGNEADAILLIQNCVIAYSGNSGDLTAQFKNCITACSFSTSGCSVYNCIVNNSWGGFSTATKSNVWNLGDNDMYALFANGNFFEFKDDWNYTLTSEAAAQYLGTDGTQIGIYGGTTPFTDIPSNPQVVSKEIAAESDANGKLSVKIKVEAQQ